MHCYRDGRSNEARVVGGDFRAAHQLVYAECSGDYGDEAERDQADRRQPLSCGVGLARRSPGRAAQSRNAGGHFAHSAILTMEPTRGLRTVVGWVIGMLVSLLNEPCCVSKF